MTDNAWINPPINEAYEEMIDESQKPSKIDLPTASDILNLELPEPIWIVPGYFPAGMSILAARPKKGKSWLAFQICHAVVTGGMIFDRKVEQGPVLYLALEDNLRRLQGRMRVQGWKTDEVSLAHMLTFDLFVSKIGYLNKGGTQRLEALIEANEYRLVVVDTLSRAFAGIKDINDSQDVTAALSPLHDLAGRMNMAILLIDHHGKQNSFSQDPIDNVMGSTAKSGVSDSIYGMYTEQGKRGATLKVKSRDMEDFDKRIVFDKLTGAWQVVGDTDEISITEKQNEILAALSSLGKSKVSAIAAYMGSDRANTAHRLDQMVEKNLITEGVMNGVKYYSRQ